MGCCVDAMCAAGLAWECIVKTGRGYAVITLTLGPGNIAGPAVDAGKGIDAGVAPAIDLAL